MLKCCAVVTREKFERNARADKMFEDDWPFRVRVTYSTRNAGFFSRVILLWMHCAQEFRSELFEQTFVVESKSICHGRKSDPADGKRVRINRYYRWANYSNPRGHRIR